MLADTTNMDPVYFGSTEGLHRGIAVTHVITESKINAFTAQPTQGSLTYRSFIDNGLLPQKAPNVSAIPTAVAAALDADKHEIMISTPITTLVTYVTNPNDNAMDALKAFRRKSQGISDS